MTGNENDDNGRHHFEVNTHMTTGLDAAGDYPRGGCSAALRKLGEQWRLTPPGGASLGLPSDTAPGGASPPPVTQNPGPPIAPPPLASASAASTLPPIIPFIFRMPPTVDPAEIIGRWSVESAASSDAAEADEGHSDEEQSE
ncbi:hypothetical protein K438DRAFT_1763772 [Mycena galopus ATCC 62051]|nr:hypothetical protein K438DRAFT_1763772 [Mycena galopus ATCC 62051]